MTERSNVTWTAVATALGTAGAVYGAYWLYKQKDRETDRLPFAPAGMWKSMQGLDSPDSHNFLMEQAKALGEANYRFCLPMIPPYLYVVGDPTVAREILMDQSSDKPIPIYRALNYVTCGRPNIFTSPNNQHWKCVRKGTVPAFSSSEIDRINKVCREQVEIWIKDVLEPLAESGGSFDPAKEMIKITFRVVCHAAFEYPSVSDDEIKRFGDNLEKAAIEFDRRETVDPTRKFMFFAKERQEALKGCSECIDFGYKILHNYRNSPTKSTNKTVIRLLEENDHLQNDDMKVAELLTFLSAAHDTTGSTLAFTLNLLAKHPSICQDLREALKQNSGKNCDYLQWVLKESSRLCPVADFGAARVTGRDHVVSRPSKSAGKEAIIPKGSWVLTPQIIPNYNPDIYPDPERFHPRRWEKPTFAMTQAHTPFALGSRNCIGRNLAQAELNTVTSMIVERFSLCIDQEGKAEHAFTLRLVGSRLAPQRV